MLGLRPLNAPSGARTLDTLIKSFRKVGVFMHCDYVLENDSYNVNLSVPADLFRQVNQISISFKSDLESDFVLLLQSYVKSYQNLLRDPAAKSLLEVKS